MDPNLSMRDEDTALRERVGVLQAENTRLRERDERHRGLFSAMDEGFALLEVILDEAGRPTDLLHLEVNDAFAEMIGIPPEAMIGRTTRELLPAISPWWVETLAGVALTGDPARFARYGEVTRRHYDVHAWSPKAGLCAALFRDVSERRETEQALRESEERLRLASSAAELGVFEWHLPSDTVHWDNARMYEIFGRTPEEAPIGRATFEAEVLEPEDQPAFEHALTEAMQPGKLFQIACRIRRRNDGQQRWIEYSGQFELTPDGSPLRLVGVIADITERKQSEEQLRTTLESIGDGFIACDSEWRFVYINAAAERLIGMRREDIIDKSFWEVFPLTIGTRLEREYRRAAAGEPVDFDNYYTPWGRWFHNRCFPREGGGLSVYFQDITERKLAEEATQESEQRFRELADAMPQLVWTARPDGTVDYYNRRYREFAAITRLPSDTTPQGEIWEWAPVLHPDDVEATVEAWQRSVATGTAYEIEHRVRRADGSYRWYLSRGVPVRDAEGRVTKWYGTATDIHAAKVAEQALRESEERFRGVLENSRDVVYRSNLRADGYDYLSPSVKALTGFTERELMMRPLNWARERVHPEDRQRYLSGIDALRQRPAGERSEVIEYRWRHKSGKYRWISNNRTLLTDAEGRPLALVGTLRDLTGRKEIEQRLQALNETLEERVAERTRQLRALAAELAVAEERERRRLARILHDDLQQSLAAAVYHLESSRGRTSTEEGGDGIEQSVAMLREAIETSRSLTAELSPTILYDSGLEAALLWLGRRMEQMHGLRVAVEAAMSPNGARISEDLKLLLYHSVRELLFNVVKHAGVDDASVFIARPTPETVEVIVVDRGRGFDARRRIERLRSSSGFGLLSITERLEYVGGSARIESAPGRGTRVTLIAPLQPPPSPDEAPNGAEGVTRADAEEMAATDTRIRILLADDHAIVRKGLLRLLEDQPDFVVVGEAADGHAAVEMAQELHPDVVLMDLAMPNMDGIEATRHIAADLADVRIIGLSMYDDPEKERLMRQAGAEGYIAKGGPPEALFAAIRANVRE